MKIIIDSNVLFSALIEDSKTRELILENEGPFLFPSFIFDEFEKHKKELYDKSEMQKGDFDELLKLITSKVEIVPKEKLIPNKEKAVEIIRDRDKDDITFIACALAYPNSVIWSDDKKLKRQKKIVILNTQEIMDFFANKQAPGEN